MTPRVRIGSAVDHEHRHYRFERNSGLPYGTFGQRHRWFVRDWVPAICVGGLLICLACGWGGR